MWIRAPIELSSLCCVSVQFSRSVVSDSLRPHESQHARPPCPSPAAGVYSRVIGHGRAGCKNGSVTVGRMLWDKW